jgi:hypothetical protein
MLNKDRIGMENQQLKKLSFLRHWDKLAGQTMKDKLVISIETDSTTDRDSLRVDIRPATSVEETIDSSWSTVSTDFFSNE